jgi:hypothetical protein
VAAEPTVDHRPPEKERAETGRGERPKREKSVWVRTLDRKRRNDGGRDGVLPAREKFKMATTLSVVVSVSRPFAVAMRGLLSRRGLCAVMVFMFRCW